jgi:xanthine dehydrogenase iron-sulfur cluster and FAD-binding subunit A
MSNIVATKCGAIVDWVWKDCDLEGHEEGCYMVTCPACGVIERDCEENNG